MIANNMLLDAYVMHLESKTEYFKPWTYTHPLLIRPRTDQQVARLQKIMYKIISHFVNHYPQYESLMPLDDKAKRVLHFFKDKEYYPGSYRTDFIIDENLQFKLIEITCRFALNGFWLSGFMEGMTEEYCRQRNIPHEIRYESFLRYLHRRMVGKEIVILSHKGKSEESRHYQSILEDAGMNVRKIYLEETEEELKNIEHKFFITEFNQEDYFQLSDFALEQLAKAEIINDLRTVFLIHDKRFFSILGNADIRNAILSEEEIELLDQFYIPTYSYGQHEDQWKAAEQNKDSWILKHKHLGKSASVYAGPVTDEKEWKQLFEQGEIENMVLQPFIKQPTFKGTVGDVQHQDYIVGTMLFFDNYYFGLGIFRASSHPVTNVVDDRKVMHRYLGEEKPKECDIVL